MSGKDTVDIPLDRSPQTRQGNSGRIMRGGVEGERRSEKVEEALPLLAEKKAFHVGTSGDQLSPSIWKQG